MKTDGDILQDVEFAAHIRGDIVQTVKEHVTKTATYAAEDLKCVDMYHAGYAAGLLHDMGKYSSEFQKCIRKSASGMPVKKGSVNHTFAGVIWVWEQYHTDMASPYEKITAEIIAYAIGAHHGLFDSISENGTDGFEHRIKADRDAIHYEEARKNFFSQCVSEEDIDEIFHHAVKEIEQFIARTKPFCDKQREGTYAVGMLVRLVTSAVMDGDRRDTAEFMADIEYPVQHEPVQEMWKRQLDNMEAKMSGLPKSRLNYARDYISDQCKTFANKPGGIYRLSVPTGSGKTLASLRYALSHAEKYRKERIFFFIPLLSIIDQNAKIIRSYLKDSDIVLEHHSNIIIADEDEESLNKYEILTESYKQNIIVSTMVQFLNTLFEGRTTSVRRMNALSNSVIVMDEVQSIPGNMTYMVNMAINFLVYCCNTTVILCSATQPCFDKTSYPIRFSDQADMVPYNKEIWDIFKRTKVVDDCRPEGYSTDELTELASDIISKKKSLLIICNTKKEALDLYRSLSGNTEYHLFHLSTSMCMQHRMDTMEQIQDILGREKVIVVSTQLVEAGVDISFEAVIRVLAGIDNITQAAGRCNRNGELIEDGVVHIVNIQNENLRNLPDIQISQNCAQELLYQYKNNPEKFQNDILSDESVSFYYSRLFSASKKKSQFAFPVVKSNTNIFTMLSDNKDFMDFNFDSKGKKPKAIMLMQAFKTAGHEFHVFDNATTDLLVPYGKQGEAMIEMLGSDRALRDLKYLKECLDAAKPYTISVFQYQLQKLQDNGGVVSYFENSLMILQPGFYDQVAGLDVDGHGAMGNLII